MFESCRAHHSNFVGMTTPRSLGDKPHLTSFGASMSESCRAHQPSLTLAEPARELRLASHAKVVAVARSA
jgi:hypothetical protein